MDTYQISNGNQIIGVAQVSKEGLYYKIACHCKLPMNAIHRIYVSNDTVERDLGICVPQGGEFVLERKIPIKHIGQDKLKFYTGKKKEKEEVYKVPVCRDEPFEAMKIIRRGRFAIHDGKPYIVFPQGASLELEK